MPTTNGNCQCGTQWIKKVLCEHAVTPELVQTLPSTTQRALGTQLMFLLEFAYQKGRMISNCELGREIQRRTTQYL